MESIFNQVIAIIAEWFSRPHWLNISIIIVITFIFYKFTRPVSTWLTNKAIKFTSKESALSNLERHKRTKTVTSLIGFLINAAIVVIAGYTVLTELGFNLAPLVASAGVAGIAIGFGSQQIIRDIFAGFLILLENQYRVDDVIRVSGVGLSTTTPVEGVVQSITMRKTTLRDQAGNVHIIPNGTIVEVVNKTLGYSKFRFTMEFDPDSDVDLIIKTIDRVGEKMASEKKWKEAIVTTPQYEEFTEISRGGISIAAGGRTAPGQQWKVGSEFRKRLVSEFQKSSIGFAKK